VSSKQWVQTGAATLHPQRASRPPKIDGTALLRNTTGPGFAAAVQLRNDRSVEDDTC
jgi:hypothetical protein